MHILIIPSCYKTPEKLVKGTFFEEQARMFQKRKQRRFRNEYLANQISANV